MNFLKSCLFGCRGSFSIGNHQVDFDDFSCSYTFWLNYRITHILTMSYLHSLIHELGHLFAFQVVSGGSPCTVNIQTNSIGGYTRFGKTSKKLSPLECSMVYLAGPLANVIFSSGKIIAAAALNSYSPPLAVVIGAQGTFWILKELQYMIISTKRNDDGDFAQILKIGGETHQLYAMVILVSCSTLGIFTAYKCLS